MNFTGLRFGWLYFALSSMVVAETVGPWKPDELKNTVPAVTRLDQNSPIHSLLYEGEEFDGHSTEVFAFYASPTTIGTAAAGKKYPGVVLIHGGGGTAFAEWVYLWAERGYAAIAMDLAGSRPPEPAYHATKRTPIPNARDPKSRTRLKLGGPDHGADEKFSSIGGEVNDDWPYHAVSSVLRAHSLLRSFDEVDADRTAVTGISWGGYTTCLVASLDDRFKAAVPVYGCGFLFEGESVQKSSLDKLGDRADDWIREYDPSRHLERCRVPMLFVNGTNDQHYPLDSYMKSFALVSCEKHLRVEVEMAHGHPAGWAPIEIGRFIDSKCGEAEPLPTLSRLELVGDRLQTRYASRLPLKKAELHYTEDDGPRSKRTWKTLTATIEPGVVSAPLPPIEANTWFLSIVDQADAMVGTPVEFR